jgi:hypothetical protein
MVLLTQTSWTNKILIKESTPKITTALMVLLFISAKLNETRVICNYLT